MKLQVSFVAKKTRVPLRQFSQKMFGKLVYVLRFYAAFGHSGGREIKLGTYQENGIKQNIKMFVFNPPFMKIKIALYA